MLIRMKKTTPVSTTGLNNLVWEKGEVYDAPKDLARSLVKAELAVTRKNVTVPEEAPEGKPGEVPEGKSDQAPEDTSGQLPKETRRGPKN